MEHIALQSSQLASVAYDAATETMQALFRRGGLYSYADVPESAYQGVLNPDPSRFAARDGHPSHYLAFDHLIKRAGYPYRKLGNTLEDGTRTTVAPPELKPDPVFDAPRETKAAKPETLTVTEAPAEPAALILPPEAAPVKAESVDIATRALGLTVSDEASDAIAKETLQAVAGMQTKIQAVFKPIKEKAWAAHKQVCESEKAMLQDLVQAEAQLKRRIGAYFAEQSRLAKVEEDRRREEEKVAAAERDRLASINQAVEQAVDLTQRGNVEAAERVLASPAPVRSSYQAPAAVAPPVAQVKGTSQRMAWTGMRIVDEMAIPREWLMVNESGIRKAGKDTGGKIKIAGVEFFEEPVVTTSRKG